MKSLNSIKNYALALLALTFMLTAANAQSRYKHVPRVKVEGKKTEKMATKEKATVTPAATTTTAEYINVDENKAVATVPTTSSDNTSVASTSENVVVVDHKTTTSANKVVKNNKKADKGSFTQKLKENTKLMDVKEVKKSNLERWLLIFIILISAAVLFLILAIVFSVALYYTTAVLGLIFWIFAGLCFLGAFIVLILGLTGVM